MAEIPDGGWYRGTARGGPLDGSEILVQGDDHISMRGIVVHVLTGDDTTGRNAAVWDTYGFAQSPDPDEPIGIFDYLGTVGQPNYPETWPGRPQV